jgi:hypothetical protein
MESDRLSRKADGRFTRICKRIAGMLRMDTLGSLKRITVVLAIVAGYNYPIISRRSVIHSHSNKSGTT